MEEVGQREGETGFSLDDGRRTKTLGSRKAAYWKCAHYNVAADALLEVAKFWSRRGSH